MANKTSGIIYIIVAMIWLIVGTLNTVSLVEGNSSNWIIIAIILNAILVVWYLVLGINALQKQEKGNE